MRNANRTLPLAALALLCSAVPAGAWHGKGHHVATTLAIEAAGGDLPKFLTAGAPTAAHCSLDPDLFTHPIAPAALHGAEAPEHYFDVELLAGAAPPATRYEFLALCARKGLKGDKVGLLPYAVTEWTGRLTVALAEHRANPDNPHVRTKCLVYAGILSHYAEDLCQPLHLTVHWDGRAKADGTSPRTGIHKRVDALLGKLRFDKAAVLKGVRPEAFDKLLPAVLAEIGRGHRLVDRVYEIEKHLPAMDKPLAGNTPAGRFAAERLTAAVRFTASLHATAWKDSRTIKLPSWYTRPFPPPVPASTRRAAAPPCPAPRPPVYLTRSPGHRGSRHR